MKYAVISVFDKTGIDALAEHLVANGYCILSTGGTFKYLRSIMPTDKLIEISDYTGSKELLGGRVKTLHPAIHAGILAKRDVPEHMVELSAHNIHCIDIVAVNLYPFKETVEYGSSEDVVMENIDIGGRTLINAAIKNYRDVAILTNPAQYEQFMTADNSAVFRRVLAKAATRHIMDYDICIARYFDDDLEVRAYDKQFDLKYGSNPQQSPAAAYSGSENMPFKVLNGKPGHINIIDAMHSWQLVSELRSILGLPAAASFKHTSPAGAAVYFEMSGTLAEVYDVKGVELTPLAIAFIRARNADPLSSYGDFIALSDEVDECTARLIKREVSDGVIAPGFTAAALDVLRAKKNGDYIVLQADPGFVQPSSEMREYFGVALCQPVNKASLTPEAISSIPPVTARSDFDAVAQINAIIANTAIKYAQSNTIGLAVDGQIIGLGCGQQNRVGCVELAVKKALIWYGRQSEQCRNLKFREGLSRTERVNATMMYIKDSFTEQEYKYWEAMFDEVPASRYKQEEGLDGVVLASDAFMPFRDSIDAAADAGVTHVVQPGGSNGDKSCIEACDEYGMTMIMTGQDMRMFYH